MPSVRSNVAAFRLCHDDQRFSPIAIKRTYRGQQAEASGELSEELEKVIIGQDQEQYFQVGSQLPPLEKAELVKFLKANIDVFT